MTVIDFIYTLEGSQQDLFRVMHSFLSDYGLTPSIKYNIPFYSGKKPVCYANPKKSNGIEIVFWKAQAMKKSLPLLNLQDRKSMAGITYKSLEEVDFELLDSIMKEAILRDQVH